MLLHYRGSMSDHRRPGAGFPPAAGLRPRRLGALAKAALVTRSPTAFSETQKRPADHPVDRPSRSPSPPPSPLKGEGARSAPRLTLTLSPHSRERGKKGMRL